MPSGHTASGVSYSLIRSAQGGDRAAFEDLVRHCRKRVTGTIARMIARPEDVEDVAQEAFLRMYHSVRRLQVPESFDLWTYRLTVNAAYDYLRKRPRKHEVRIGDLMEAQFAAANDAASRQRSAEERHRIQTIEYVDSLLARVSHADRILLVMHELDGLEIREIAGVLGIRAGAVKVRLFRARNRLRSMLSREEMPPRVARLPEFVPQGI